MPRIIRNYIISFIIIGLILLAVHLIDKSVEERMPANQSAAGEGTQGSGAGSGN